jgi:threonine/homoserine/homoserine lactone efflux protein
MILGMSAGFSPGPLFVLLVSESLQNGMKSGIKIALAPLITDLPIIFLTLFLSAKLSGLHSVLGVISIIGGLFVMYLGVQRLLTKGVELRLGAEANSLTKGITVNALSPHPYLFWFGVGAPLLAKAMTQDIFVALSFLGSFYVLLLGSMVLLALLIGRFRSFLNNSIYIYTMRFLGLVLCILAIVLFRDGLSLIKRV